MNRAIEGLSIRPDLCLIDGNRDHGSSVSITAPHMCLVGGDGKSASIAAASILAKVSRDRYVTGVLDREYPQYQFAKHKGYGTKLHYEMLDRYGPCPAHRRTFSEEVGGPAHMNTTKALGTGARPRRPNTCGSGALRCWPANGAAGTESWIWWPGTETAPSALWK